MQQIDNLSDAASQSSDVVLGDGSVVTFTLTYQAATQRWSLDVSYGTFQVFGINLCAGVNVLDTWAQVIPFGLACVPVDGVDPVYIQDFSNGRVALYVLSAAEVKSVAAGNFG